MLSGNWLAAWLLLIFAFIEYGPSLFEKRCPRCGHAMYACGQLELLMQRGDRYWGWRTFQCAGCKYQETRLTYSSDPNVVVYQTHVVISRE